MEMSNPMNAAEKTAHDLFIAQCEATMAGTTLIMKRTSALRRALIGLGFLRA